jgi:hypothetical protein
VLRGGSFNNEPINSRCANRNDNVPGDSNNNVGFRAASTLRCQSRAAGVSRPRERATEESPGSGPVRRSDPEPNAAEEATMGIVDESDPPPGQAQPAPAGTSSERANKGDRPAAVEACRSLLLWLVPTVAKFPRALRFTLGERIEVRCYDVLENLVRATYAPRGAKAPYLDRANLDLEVLRHEVRVAHDLRQLSIKQIEHSARLVDAVGRQVGAWRKSAK